jgi:hypothetical protein
MFSLSYLSIIRTASLNGKYSSCLKVLWTRSGLHCTTLLFLYHIYSFHQMAFKDDETLPKHIEKMNRALLSCTECHRRKQKVTTSIFDGRKLSQKALRKAIGLTVFTLSATGLYFVMTIPKREYPTNVVMKHESKHSETAGDLVAKLPTEACQVRH